MLSRTSSSLLSSASSSSSLVARACFSTSSASSQRTKDGPSTMGVGRKARVGAHYHKDGGGVVQFQGHRTPKKGTVDKPHLEGGHLSKVSITLLSFSVRCRTLQWVLSALTGRRKEDTSSFTSSSLFPFFSLLLSRSLRLTIPSLLLFTEPSRRPYRPLPLLPVPRQP